MLPIIKTNKKQDTYLQVIRGVYRIFKNIGGGEVKLLSDKNLTLPPLKFLPLGHHRQEVGQKT